MRFAIALALFAGLTHARADSPVIDASVPANAPISTSAVSQPVVVGFDADGYMRDCTALVAQWRELQQLETELGR